MNLYAATATTFTDNGLMILNPSSAEVREQINGDFALIATFPQDDSAYLIEDRILTCNTPRGKQPFRIREISKTLDGSVEIYAPHLFYDLADYFIEDIYPTADTGLEAITAILGATTELNGFTGSSNIATTQNARYVMQSPVSCLLDKSKDECYLNRWGGEILRDGYSIAINTRIGADNGVQIRYRKNLTGLTARSDLSTVKTRILPTGLNADDTLLEGAYVDSAHISNYAHPKVGRAHFGDVKIGAEVDGVVLYTDEAAALAELATRAAALFAAGLDVPTITLDVEFADLSQTVEYAQYAALETVSLGDTVTVIHEPLNVNCTLRVVEYAYDPSLQRYISLIIGALPENIGTSVIAADVDISAIKDDLEQGVLRRGETYNAVSINHTDGFAAETVINGQTVKVSMNATDGLAVYVDDVKVGGMYVINGEVRMVARTLADPEGGEQTYVSLEPDPDVSGLESMRFFVKWSGTWYEDMRIRIVSTTISEIIKYNTTSASGLLIIRTQNASGDSGRIVLWNDAIQLQSGSNTDYCLFAVNKTNFQMQKMVGGSLSTLETWT